MILKFWNPETKSWVYEDGIARVSQKACGEIVLMPGDGETPPRIAHKGGGEEPVECDWIVGDFLKWAKEHEYLSHCVEGAAPLKLNYVFARYRDGRDKSFLFRGEGDRVYLLNDEGKTIERL